VERINGSADFLFGELNVNSPEWNILGVCGTLKKK
jgi:hypothetical protein